MRRVFRIEAYFDRPAACGNIGLREAQRFAVCDAQLLVHEVDAVDEFGDRMLHLQARIHFEKRKRSVGSEQELDRSGIRVAHAAGGGHRFLNDFLVAALDRTFALAEVYGRAVRIGENLKLDVPRPAQVALQQNGIVAE